MAITLLLLSVVGVAYVFFLYNLLVKKRVLMQEAWSDIDVQLKRRADLIPPLVETARGYAGHERSVLEKVTEARTRAMNEATVGTRARGESDLSREVKSLLALAESYPDLKASSVFLDLQRNLVEIEDQIQYARRYYNGTVRSYNSLAQSFPSNLIAASFKFESADFFELDLSTDRQTPAVSL